MGIECTVIDPRQQAHNKTGPLLVKRDLGLYTSASKETWDSRHQCQKRPGIDPRQQAHNKASMLHYTQPCPAIIIVPTNDNILIIMR